jgi:hypothetical protein
MLISLGKCFKSNAVPKIFTVDTKKKLKRRQQRIMMQKICTEDKKKRTTRSVALFQYFIIWYIIRNGRWFKNIIHATFLKKE